MTAPIDLSTLKNGKPAGSPEFSVDSLNPDEQEALAKMAEEHPEAAAAKVTTAFLLVLQDGQWMATPDVNTPLTLERQADTEDMWIGATKVARDIDVAETAQAVVGMQQHLAMQIQQQQQAARIAQGLNL